MNRIQAMLARHIREHGVVIQFVFATEEHPGPTFAYTIGMTDIGAPELIVFGFPQELAGGLMNHLFNEMRTCNMPRDLEKIEDLMSVPLLLESIDSEVAGEYAVQADVYYAQRERKPVFKQILWPDEKGCYPYEKGFDRELKDIQPYLGNKGKRLDLGDESLSPH